MDSHQSMSVKMSQLSPESKLKVAIIIDKQCARLIHDLLEADLMTTNQHASQRFSTTTSYLKRRFSQGDLSGENEEETSGNIGDTSNTPSNITSSVTSNIRSTVSNVTAGRPTSATPVSDANVISSNTDPPKSLPFTSKSNITSAPTSPSKSVSSFLSRATSITSSVRDSVTSNVAGVAGQLKDRIKDTTKQKILLIIDDNQTDWSRYFKGRKVQVDYDIKIEQAEFTDLNVVSNSETGVNCGVFVYDKTGNRTVRNFRPDFVLVRQHMKNLGDDHRPIILGLQYGAVPSVNSLQSLYNFTDRPWVFSQLIRIQKKLGKENFPLIEQTFFPNYKEMLANPPKLPCVIKVGHAHSGQGKIRVESTREYQDVVSIIACSNTFCTSEPFIEAKCDIHIQKIASNYKAFMRKSISGNWKANVGSSVLEQVPVTERYKKWLDEVSNLFDGLDMLTVEAVADKDGREIIYEVTGSQMPLMGESQEEDRKLIADLICSKMNSRVNIGGRSSIAARGEQMTDEKVMTSSLRRESATSSSSVETSSSLATGATGNVTASTNTTGTPSTAATSGIQQQMEQTAAQIKGLIRRASQVASDDTTNRPSGTSSGSSVQASNSTNTSTSSPATTTGASVEVTQSEEDTMKNLRKTFAGIFGDM